MKKQREGYYVLLLATADGAFVREAFKYDRNSWGGRIMFSLAKHYGFSIDTPFEELPQRIVDTLLYGTHGERFAIAIRSR